MTPLIKKAQRGKQDAFEALYNANKKKVLYLANLLLCDSNSAESACIHVFKSAWQFVLDGKIESEQEFNHFVIDKTVNHCKNKISKVDSKAFKIPTNKNFTVSEFDFDFILSNDIGRLSISSLPAIHRFIYILDSYVGWAYDDIAELLHTKEDTVKLALDAKKQNFERFSNAVKHEKGVDTSFGIEDFKDYIFDCEIEFKVSESVDAAVFLSIYTVTTPIINAKKKKNLRIGVIAGISLFVAILLALVIVTVCLLNNDDSAETDVEETYDDYYDSYEDLQWVTKVENPTQYAVIDIANYGKITVALDEGSAPKTVENFVSLAKEGFYDGLTFHRIIGGYIMQGGDPDGNGMGGNTDESGNEINVVGEFYYNGYNNLLSHVRGAISMARASDYDSASSQFFIVQEDCAEDLDGFYAVFGFVVDGMDVVDAVCNSAEPTDTDGTIETSAQPVINSIKIYTPEEYAVLKESEPEDTETESGETEEEITVIEAKLAEVSAISSREGSLFITVYGLNEDSADYQITDAANIDLSKYEATKTIEKYLIDSATEVYEAKEGALVEFEASNIAEGDMIAIYTDADENINVVVYHIEIEEGEESTEGGEPEDPIEG